MVSRLESDSELYNAGIVDKSYKYPKMYVVRPQFLFNYKSLRDTSLKSLEVKNQLLQSKNNMLMSHILKIHWMNLKKV